jgi:membrane-associated phospholipid phosphatase
MAQDRLARLHRLILAAAAAAFVLLAAPAHAGSPGSASDADAGADEPPAPVVKALYEADDIRTLGRMPLNMLEGVVGVWNPDNLTPLLIGSVTASSASYLDRTVQASLSSPNGGFGTFAETGGGPIISTSVVGGLFVWGRLDHVHPRWRAATYDMLDASLVNLLYTEAIKATTHRERPDGADNKSFPSGHASNAFALATCFERHYGWRVSLPAYLAASAVAASRLQRNKHFLSDVTAGAALGYVIGRTVARVNGRPLHPEEKRGASLVLRPLLGRRSGGLEVSVAFR